MSEIPPGSQDPSPPQYSQYPRGPVGSPINAPMPVRPPGVYWDYISIAFNMVIKNPGAFVVASLITFLASFILQLPGTVVQQVSLSQVKNPQQVFAIMPLSLALSIPAMIVSYTIMSGFSVMAIETADTGTTTVNSLFAPFKRVLPVLGASFTGSLIAFFGAMLCLIPGIAALGAVSFAPVIALYEGKGTLDSLGRSWEMSKAHMWGLGFLILVAILLNILGYIACCVGILVTLPIAYMVIGLHYRDFSRSPAQPGF